jgi:1-deoxy-D-xylulose-5-phosphate reductoisomerase
VKRVVILGSTGSIGVQALNIIRRYPQLFEVAGLTAHSNTQLLAQQVKEFKPAFSAITSQEEGGATRIAAEADCDLVLNAIVGIAGLEPTLAAIKSGRKNITANTSRPNAADIASPRLSTLLAPA